MKPTGQAGLGQGCLSIAQGPLTPVPQWRQESWLLSGGAGRFRAGQHMHIAEDGAGGGVRRPAVAPCLGTIPHRAQGHGGECPLVWLGEDPGRVSYLAPSGGSAGTFCGTSLWGCRHSGFRKQSIRTCLLAPTASVEPAQLCPGELPSPSSWTPTGVQ